MVFQIDGKYKLWSMCLRISIARNYHPAIPLFVLCKIFTQLVTNSLVDQLQKCFFFLISNTLFRLLVQLQIF